eukprot:jgi/Mesvir1/6121/Mv00826-RA.1
MKLPCIAMQQALLYTCVALALIHAANGQDGFDPTQWAALSTPGGHSPIWHEWHDNVPDYVQWATGPNQNLGAACDARRTSDATPVDAWEGCAVVWLAEVQDTFTAKQLPATEQDGYQNTQHYKKAWNFDKPRGFQGDAMPIAGTDLDATCYVVKKDGEWVLGYEEGGGDAIIPCKPCTGAFEFTSAMLMTATQAQLQSYCNMCYQASCTHAWTHSPKDCGYGYCVGSGWSTILPLSMQATPAYHCHLTMSNNPGSCQYLQKTQHEKVGYNMSSATICGWQNIRDFRLTDCDCTRQNGTSNGCNLVECWKMAAQGIVCGNCGSTCNSRARKVVFHLPGSPESDARYYGACAAARTLRDTQPGTATQKEAERFCAEAVLCQQPAGSVATINTTSQSCNTYCQLSRSGALGATDPRCPVQARRRSLLSDDGSEESLDDADSVEDSVEVIGDEGIEEVPENDPGVRGRRMLQ